MSNNGRDFEEAVRAFLSTLDGECSLEFDCHRTSPATGIKRQVDGWITFKLLGHFPLQVLISCKDHSRPLDIGAIDQFASERNSVCADLGVIYSRSGFTKNAVKHAQSLKIQCCQLYRDGSWDVPNAAFVQAYFAVPNYWVSLFSEPTHDGNRATWARYFRLARQRKHSMPLEELLSCQCTQLGLRLGPSFQGMNGALEDGLSNFELPATERYPGVYGEVVLNWSWFRGLRGTQIVNGSFNESTQEFAGTVKVQGFGVTGDAALDLWSACPPPTDPGIGIGLTVAPAGWPQASFFKRFDRNLDMKRPLQWEWSMPGPHVSTGYAMPLPDGEVLMGCAMAVTFEFRGRPGQWDLTDGKVVRDQGCPPSGDVSAASPPTPPR